MNFIYKLKDDRGRTLLGFMEAKDRLDLKRRLGNLPFYFVAARSVDPKSIRNRTTSVDMLLMFTHRLASLIDSGIPILVAMNILWRQTEDETLQLVVSHLRCKLEEGNRISEALSDFPQTFPPLYRALIHVSEQSGQFVAILRRLAIQLEAQRQFQVRIKKITLYPTFVMCFATLVVLGIFIFVVPFFQKILSGLTTELPALTKAMFVMSEVIRSWYFWGIIFSVGISFFVTLKLSSKSSFLPRLIEEIKTRIPYLGGLLYTINISQFLHALAVLLTSGVTIVQSLEIAKTTVSNKKIVRGIDQVERMIQQGSSIYAAIDKVRIFPIMANELIGAGEMSGRLTENLELIGKHLDEEVDFKINKFLTLLEPFLVIFIGCAVLLTMLALYVPIFTIWETLLK